MKAIAAYIFAATFAVAYGQGPLNTFTTIREALEEGSDLQLNAYSQGCVTNYPDPLIVSMPLRQWQHIIPPGGQEEIRADDFYIETQDPAAITWITRTINIYENNDVLVTLSVTGSNETNQIVMQCALGDGAIAHRLIQGNDIEILNGYNQVKSHLLLGEHVEAIGYLNQCDNADEVFADGSQYIVGYQILRFEVINDGTQDEAIIIDDVAILSSNGSSFSVGAEQVIIPRNGDSIVTVAIFDGTLNELTNFQLTCSIGTALRFTVHRRENEETLTSYAAIRESTLAGHDMEMVVFLGMCTVLEGDAVNTPGVIVSARADEFQLFKAGSIWGEQEHISYSSWTLDVAGEVVVEIVRLFDDGSLTIEWLATSPSAGSTSSGLLNCPLERATLFHAVRRDRAPVTDYANIIGDILGRGQIFEIEIDYDACDTGDVQFGSIFGGIAWETYIDPAIDTGFFYANEFALVTQNITGTLGLAWDAAGIAVLPDNTVVISARLYDFASGANLIDQTDSILCTLGQGVTFFRYP